MQPSIGILLRELTRLYTQAQRDHVTSGHDTSSTQSHVLMELGRAGVLTQHELGRRLSLDKGWVSRAVESLVQAGLVAKTRHENDRRSRWLQLTSKGKVRYQALNESLDTHAELLMQPLSGEQRDLIHQALILLITGLQRAMPEDDAEQAATAPVVAEPVALAAPVETATAAPEIVPAVAEPIALRDTPAEQPAGLAAAAAAPVEATADAEREAEVLPDVVAAAPVAEAAPAEADEALVEETVGAEAVAAEARSPASAPSAAADSAPPATDVPVAAASAAAPVADKPAEAPRSPVVRTTPRIVGSKTLPTRPLLSSRQTPRTPLSRAALSAEQKSLPASLMNKPLLSRLQAQARLQQHEETAQPAAPQPAAAPVPPVRTHAPLHGPTRPLGQTAVPVPPQRPAASAARPAPAGATPVTSHPQHQDRSGGLFQKLLSQGSLFNKLLQREQPQEEPQTEAPAPAEVEPQDGVLFQQASPTDWNEIRNLLTASRMPVQGALNHLSNFVVATENGRVVGAIGMEVYSDIGLVRSLVVASNMRGRAIAKRLVKHLIQRAQTRGLGALYLLSGPGDPLFLRHGFEKMPRADMPTKLFVSTELQGPTSSSPVALRLFL